MSKAPFAVLAEASGLEPHRGFLHRSLLLPFHGDSGPRAKKCNSVGSFASPSGLIKTPAAALKLNRGPATNPVGGTNVHKNSSDTTSAESAQRQPGEALPEESTLGYHYAWQYFIWGPTRSFERMGPIRHEESPPIETLAPRPEAGYAGGWPGRQPTRTQQSARISAQLREILTVNLSIRGPHKTLRRHAVTRKGVYE